jgi:1-acyl-sn-glycerol-3-phosphate acyltransferase
VFERSIKYQILKDLGTKGVHEMSGPSRDGALVKTALKVFDFFHREDSRGIRRQRVMGLEKLPEGPCLLIANHNIVAPLEILILLSAWERRFQGQRPVHGLAHRFPFRIPGVRGLFKRLGAVPATHAWADRVLRSGASLVVFPGGNFESTRAYSERAICDFGGKKGWIEIALRNAAPIIPVSISGAHAMNPVLWRSEFLSYMLILPKLLGIRWFPVTLAQVVYTLTGTGALHAAGISGAGLFFAAWALFTFTPQLPVLPRRITIRIGDAIPVEELKARGLTREEIYSLVLARVQEGIRCCRIQSECHDRFV